MSNDLDLAQKHAWNLAHMVPVILKVDEAYGFIRADELTKPKSNVAMYLEK